MAYPVSTEGKHKVVTHTEGGHKNNHKFAVFLKEVYFNSES